MPTYAIYKTYKNDNSENATLYFFVLRVSGITDSFQNKKKSHVFLKRGKL